MKTQQEQIYQLICQRPGSTATGLVKHLKTVPMSQGGPNRHYLAPTVLRSLHRLVAKKLLRRANEPGLRPTVKAWRFYPI